MWGEKRSPTRGGEEIADGRRDRQGEGGRGNSERWTATATARLRLAANGLASLDFSSLLGSVYCDFLRSVNRFHFLVIYRILGFICWKFKNGSRVWIFCQGNKIIFHASLIVVLFSGSWFTVQKFSMVHGLNFWLSAVILRVEWVFGQFC